jgi:hypothetical protein
MSINSTACGVFPYLKLRDGGDSKLIMPLTHDYFLPISIFRVSSCQRNIVSGKKFL